MTNQLEEAIGTKARELLAQLESQIADSSGEVERNDINSTADFIFSLVDLGRIDNNGMSEILKNELSQINIRTLHVLKTWAKE